MKANINGVKCIIEATDDGLVVLDEEGNPAEWLEEEMSSMDWIRIEREWKEKMGEERAYWRA
jgi:hypothetical protein